MNDTILKKILANTIKDAKSTMLAEGSIPLIWNMVTDELIYQIAKIVEDNHDFDIAQEVVFLSKEWARPHTIVQVANTQMNMITQGQAQKRELEALIFIVHTPKVTPKSMLCEVYRDKNGEVSGFSHFYKEQHIEFDNALFSPFTNSIDRPSSEAITMVQEMFGHVDKPMLRLVS